MMFYDLTENSFMKLTKYLLVSALLVGAAATDADAQVKNLSGKVTEIFNPNRSLERALFFISNDRH